MKNAVIAPSAISMIQNSVDASRNASFLRPFCSNSVNTGTNAADSAAFANRLANRFGTWKASVNAEAGPFVPKKLAATISRSSPATREKPVRIEKIAVLRATPRPSGGAESGCSSATSGNSAISADDVSTDAGGSSAGRGGRSASGGPSAPASPDSDKAAIVRRSAARPGS